jgi:hypothetical protein
MPIGGILTNWNGRAAMPRSGQHKGGGSVGLVVGRSTTTTVASAAIRSGSLHRGRSTRLSAPIRKKSSSSGCWLLVRRRAGHDEPDQIELARLATALGEDQVPKVYRVEGAPE